MKSKEIILLGAICYGEIDQAGRCKNERASYAVLEVFKKMCGSYEDANHWIERLENLHRSYFEVSP